MFDHPSRVKRIPENHTKVSSNMNIPGSTLLIALLFVSASALAQDDSTHPLFQDDWLISIGGQQADANVKVGLSNPATGEIPIVDLGGGSADTTVTSIWANVLWQAPERWSVGVSYFQAKADVERLSEQDFTFGDINVPAGTGFTADFETDFYVLNAFYDFYRAPNRSAGVGLGLYALDLSMSLETRVGGAATGERASADTLAPLPTISAYYRHAFNDKWAVTVDGGWLSANIDEYDGDIVAAEVSVDYWFNDRWGVGAGYTYVDLDLTVDKDIFDQKYEVEYDSFFFYATFGF